MTLPVVRSRTVFRACVVTAVREGEQLMEQLVMYATDALAKEESETRVIAKRDMASEALRLLRKHQAELVKGYPMALLEVFADGPSTAGAPKSTSQGIDFGELSLVDDDEVQAQVELSRAQQIALHTTDEVLSELNGLVSSAQGLARVQPERNPLRPENYIRALQRVVAGTQVIAPVREAWMQHMRSLLGQQLVGVYQRAAKGLREHGVEPIGWSSGRSGHAPMGHPASGYAPGWTGGHGGAASAWVETSGWGRAAHGHSAWQGDGRASMPAQVEEALLTVNILRQMLAGAGDPYQEAYASAGISAPVQLVSHTVAAPMRPGPPPTDAAYGHGAVADAMEDIAQLERLVGRLAGGAGAYVPAGPAASGHGVPRTGPASLYGTGHAAPMGAEVVARMVENISQDSRLLPPVQKAVQDLEPAIRKLIRHDPRFFTDASHPARQMLDDITQRSLAFDHVEAPGFSRFMRLIDQAVSHLTKVDITSAAPFENVRRALHAAWDAQQKKQQARQEREQRALLLAEEREMRAEQIARDIAAMPGMADAPADVAEFLLGPWVEVVASPPPEADGSRSAEAEDALALVAPLLWSVQPALAGQDPDRLDEAAMLLPVRLRAELEKIRHPSGETDAFLERLAELHRAVLLAAPPDIELPDTGAQVLGEALTPPADTPSETPAAAPEPGAAAPAEELAIGQWVELHSGGKALRTQLTWCSPHGTLFLFTAPDGSTQSMTRRMRDKLVASGGLRSLDATPVVERALDGVARAARSA